MSSATSSYWCYRCSYFIRVWSQDSITYPNCDSKFVEEIKNTPPSLPITTDACRWRFSTAAMYMIRSRSGQGQSPGLGLHWSCRNERNRSSFNLVIVLRR
ncbi:hypothetical protein NL676_029982 [Syzygium grande]|nr:hypothetical protein NL676_029982 [Syzygium grande]